jgi:hypothetical protein
MPSGYDQPGGRCPLHIVSAALVPEGSKARRSCRICAAESTAGRAGGGAQIVRFRSARAGGGSGCLAGRGHCQACAQEPLPAASPKIAGCRCRKSPTVIPQGEARWRGWSGVWCASYIWGIRPSSRSVPAPEEVLSCISSLTGILPSVPSCCAGWGTRAAQHALERLAISWGRLGERERWPAGALGSTR